MDIYQFNITTIEGKTITLEQYKNKVLLIVNVASKCGFTPQYQDLQKLYEKYHEKNFEILAFPCNQFLHQEPGDNASIKTFCETNYHISFPLFAKIEVNGNNTHPLFQYLKNAAPGIFNSKKIKWNFTKFLVDSNGEVIKRFAPKTKINKVENYLINLYR